MHADTSPITLFSQWLDDAKACPAIKEPTAMSLATADARGVPSCRIVLLKAHDEAGFVFFTNLGSQKSEQLVANPQAALTFYWMPLDRQLRIEGAVSQVEDAQADAYFATRARGSQLGAWASQQSHPLASRQALEESLEAYEQKFAGRDVPRPPHWSGWRVVPKRIEFWQQGDYRIHDRWHYVRQSGGSWQHELLYP